jgi:large subunit ribosomal protein L24
MMSMKNKLKKENENRSKKIRKGDRVLVISGNSKGMTGVIMKTQGDRMVVQGVNMRKKHVKKSQSHPKGGVIELEAPIHISRLSLCDDNGQRLKVKMHMDKKGVRSLCYMKDGKQVELRTVTASARKA